MLKSARDGMVDPERAATGMVDPGACPACTGVHGTCTGRIPLIPLITSFEK